MQLRFSIYIFIVVVFCHFTNAQTHLYTHFGVDEGLPSAEVYDVYQDKLGYIWFATDKGLSRYNGYEFENFTTKEGLLGNTILDFYPQKNGQIWCYEYHSQSLFYFDEVFNGFKDYRYNDTIKKHLESNSVVKSVFIDENEDVYLGGYLIKGYLKISKNGVLSKHWELPTSSDNTSFYIDTKKNFFFATSYDSISEESLIRFDSKFGLNSRFDVVHLDDNKRVIIDRKLAIVSKDNEVNYLDVQQNATGIKRVNNQTFFVGYYSGGAELRNASGAILASFLPNKSVTNFLVDAEGSYWFTTLDDGVFQIKNLEISIFSEDHITSLVKDDKSNLYAGHHNGNISRITNLKPEMLYKGLNDRPAYVEFDVKHSEVYGASDHKMQNLTQKRPPLPIDGITKLSEHVLNPLAGVNTNGFKTLVNNSTIEHIKVGQRTEDVAIYNDTILIATPFGLYISNSSNAIVVHQPSPLLKTRLYDIDVSNNTNQVYMASEDNGVIIYGDSIYSIQKKNGLTNDLVNEVYIENDSTIWACTNTGLNRISFQSNKSYSVNTITKSDGLLSNDINDIEIVNDTVWVATKRGLCYFEKQFFDQKQRANILSLSLKSVRINNSEVNEKNLTLSHDQNSIEFKVEAMSARSSHKIKYFYRLKEVDLNWAETANRTISFPSLSPGSYTFEAKASILDNPNNLITSYRFKIHPPFWQSWWFYTFCFVLFSLLIYLFFKIRVLTYNEDVFRELIRLAIKRLKREELFYKFRANGEDFKIPTHEILYINSQGNYLDIITTKKSYTIRCKIGDFRKTTPDALEYLRIHRSYIIRIDQVSSKGKNWVVVKGKRIPVGETYLGQLDKIHF